MEFEESLLYFPAEKFGSRARAAEAAVEPSTLSVTVTLVARVQLLGVVGLVRRVRRGVVRAGRVVVDSVLVGGVRRAGRGRRRARSPVPQALGRVVGLLLLRRVVLAVVGEGRGGGAVVGAAVGRTNDTM